MLTTRRAALATLALVPLAGTRSADERSATVILTRHAEKQAGSDPALSDRGIARADHLAAMLLAANLTHIYTTDYQRTRQTVAPVAMAVGIDPTIYDARDTGAIARALASLGDGSVALVAGHSNTVPGIAVALGGSLDGLDARDHLDESEYDRLIVLTLHAHDERPMRAIGTLDLRVSLED